MAEHEHHGAVAIVTNDARSRFFIQRKDADYRPAPRGYSLFGGAVEPGETPATALARELVEELGDAAVPLLDAGPTHVSTVTVRPGVQVSLFEIVVDDDTLTTLPDVPVLEGECGVVLDRAALKATPLVWTLGEIVAAYLASLDR